MPKKQTDEERVLTLARKQKVLRIKDLTAQGIHPEPLRRLLQKGVLTRSTRGVYHLTEGEFSEKLGLAEVAKRVPQGVFCLLTALQFHNIGTQQPHEVWLAVAREAWKPKLDYPRLRVMRFSGKALTEGIEKHTIEGVPAQVTTPAKTVADCFKYRNKVGLDVALEALRECWRARKTTMDEFWKCAKVCRVSNVMRPYLESLQ